MSEELKACPFCGQTPVLNAWGTNKYRGVFCMNEKCRVKPFTVEVDDYCATAAWNTRAGEMA